MGGTFFYTPVVLYALCQARQQQLLQQAAGDHLGHAFPTTTMPSGPPKTPTPLILCSPFHYPSRANNSPLPTPRASPPKPTLPRMARLPLFRASWSSLAFLLLPSATTVNAFMPPGWRMPPITKSAHHRAKGSSRMAITWESADGELKADGKPFRLKGISWYGFETLERCVGGIRKKQWPIPGGKSADALLGFLEYHSFNAVRLPFSTDLANRLNDLVPYDPLNPFVDQDIQAVYETGKLTQAELLHRFIDKCANHGMLVMLDNHRLGPLNQSPLWYGQSLDNDSGVPDKGSWTYTPDDFKNAWVNILGVCEDQENVFAVDLKNEPYSRGELDAQWGTGVPEKDWKMEAENVAAHIIKTYPTYKGLFFVEGIQNSKYNDETSTKYANTWWGGSFTGVLHQPLSLVVDGIDHTNRFVYSPHVNGPGLQGRAGTWREYFEAPDFPGNLWRIWDDEWGFVKDKNGRAVSVGEWGGTFCTRFQEFKEDDKGRQWHWELAKYMWTKKMTDNFYWCLNPGSNDTGGLLGPDWYTPNKSKLDILKYIVPNPSKVVKNKDGSISVYSTL